MKEDQKELMAALAQLSANIDHLGRLNSSNTNSSITVSAGGIGVWLCACACMMMLAVSMMGGMWMSREFNRIDREMADRKDDAERARTYLSAIYAQAPHLQPKDYEDAE